MLFDCDPARLSLAGQLPPVEAFPFDEIADIANDLLRAHDVRTLCDSTGMDTDVLEHHLAHGLLSKLCYLCANFSNPSGATLSEPRRRHLADLAQRFSFVIVEDDQYGRLRFSGERIAPIASMTDNAFYPSGFSKVVAPGLRVGYMTAPGWLHRPIVLAEQAADLAFAATVVLHAQSERTLPSCRSDGCSIRRPLVSAIVTGASAGIGLAVTRALCEDGHPVTMVARRESRLLAAADGLRAAGFDVHTVAQDMSVDGAAVELVVDHVSRHGGIDVVVSNAGRGASGTVAEATPSDVEKMLRANIGAPFALAAAALPLLRQSAGWFVITASLSGIWPTAGFATYSASKAAAVSLARSIAAEESANGVRACAICPAFVDTDMSSWLDGQLTTAAMLTPADVAEAVRFLMRLSASASITEMVLRRSGAPDQHAP